MPNFNIDDLDPEVREYIERVEDVALKAEFDLSTLQKSLEEGTGDEGSIDALLKSADPSVVNLVNSLRAEVSKAQETANTEREARVEREFIEKAAGFKDLPVDSGEFGRLLKSINEEVSEETFNATMAFVEKINAALEAANIFGELGSGLVTETGSTKLDEVTKSYMAEHPDVSAEEAMVAVLDENPALYDDYMTQQGG